MATVTGMTAAAMQSIRDGTVVDGHFDSAGHLILTKYDGTQIDAGVMIDTNTATKGIVELATATEVTTGTDNSRAVTPFGLASVTSTINSRLSTLEAPTLVTGITEVALPSAYPVGVSIMNIGSLNLWASFPSGYGTVVTTKLLTDRCFQVVYNLAGGTVGIEAMMRTHHSTNGGGGWTAWQRVIVMNTLVPGSFTQSTAFTSYPQGMSRLYYTTATSSAWAAFAGTAGEVQTYREGTDFARQTFIQHSGGSSNSSGMMIRTANSASGWSAWNTLILDSRVSKLASATASGKVAITPVANTPTFVTVTFPAGRFTAAPNVVVTAETSVPGTTVSGTGVLNVTATSCDVYVTRANTGATNVYWIAMQN